MRLILASWAAAALAWPADNLPPTFVAAYTGPVIGDPDPANTVPQVIEVSGIGPGAPDEAGQTVTLIAYVLEPEILSVVLNHAAGSDAATVDVRLVGSSVPRPSSRVLVTAVDDADPPGITTAVIDIPLLVVNTTPYLSSIPVVTVAPFGGHAYAPSELAPIDREGDPIYYTVDVPPVRGVITCFDPLAGTTRTLARGDWFTQDDIIARYVAYRNLDGVAGGSDNWQFILANSAPVLTGGSWFPNGQVRIGSGLAGPIVTIPVPAAAWVEGAAPAAIAAGALVEHQRLAGLAGGRLVLTPGSGWRDGDRLGLAETAEVSTSGATVQVSGGDVGVWSRSAAGGLDIDLTTPAATAAAAAAVLAAVVFDHVGDDPGTEDRHVQVVASDADGAASVAVEAVVPVVPVDDPPVIDSSPMAIPRETVSLLRLAAVDPDTAGIAWTLVRADPELGAEDLGRGVIRCTPSAAASGLYAIAVQAADGTSIVPADIGVVVSGPADPRPQPAGDTPREAFPGSTLDFTIAWDTSAFPGGADLDFSATPDAPSGMVLEPVAAGRVRATWQVPGDEPVLVHRRFAIIAMDRLGRGAGRLPVSLWISPAVQGGG